MKLYYIQHPLTELNNLSDDVCATFTDDQISEYSSLYDEYLTVQRKAASDGVDIANQLRDLIRKLFNDPNSPYSTSKQSKYFERMIRNGETIVDIHSRRYPKPSAVRTRIEAARERFPATTDSSPTHSQETLQEINNAVGLSSLSRAWNSIETLLCLTLLQLLVCLSETKLVEFGAKKSQVEGFDMMIEGVPRPISRLEVFGTTYYVHGDDFISERILKLNISFKQGKTPTLLK